MKISVVIPFYNEEEQVSDTVDALIEVLSSLDHDYELVLVDDGSSDGTWSVLEEISENSPGKVFAIGFSRNFGKEAAISAGLDKSSGDAVITMDGDLQHPPSFIPEMVSIWENGDADIVEGVKKDRKNDSLAQRLNSFFFYKIFAKISGHDLMNASDFKLLDRQVVEELVKLEEQNAFYRALTYWLGFRRKKLEFRVEPRGDGKSKWPFFKLVRLSINAITSFSAAPLYIVAFMGLAFLVISLVLGIQTFVRWVLGTAAIGFTTVILLQLFIGGLVMISLGLIGIYIARIFTEVKGRPRYIVSRQAGKIGQGHFRKKAD